MQAEGQQVAALTVYFLIDDPVFNPKRDRHPLETDIYSIADTMVMDNGLIFW